MREERRGNAAAWIVAILLVAVAAYLLTYKAPAKTRYVGDCGALEGKTFNTRCDGGALIYDTCENGTITEGRRDCAAEKLSCLTETVGNETTARCAKEGAAASASPSASPTAPPALAKSIGEMFVNLGGTLTRVAELPDTVPDACGDGKCTASETCLSCADDCACDGVCRNNGVCATPACGDGWCDGSETKENCCTDCGCANGICNAANGRCRLPIQMSEQSAYSYAMNSLGNESALYEPAYAYDGFFMNEAVKAVALRCTGPYDYICMRIVYLDANGTVVGETDSVG